MPPIVQTVLVIFAITSSFSVSTKLTHMKTLPLCPPRLRAFPYPAHSPPSQTWCSTNPGFENVRPRRRHPFYTTPPRLLNLGQHFGHSVPVTVPPARILGSGYGNSVLILDQRYQADISRMSHDPSIISPLEFSVSHRSRSNQFAQCGLWKLGSGENTDTGDRRHLVLPFHPSSGQGRT